MLTPPLMEIFHQKIFLIIDAFPDPTPGIRFPRGDLREQMEALWCIAISTLIPSLQCIVVVVAAA